MADHPTLIPAVLYREVQPMHRNPIVRYMIPLSSLTAALILLAVYSRNPDPWIPAALLLIIGLDLAALFGLSLETVVTEAELRIKFRPFPRRRIPIHEIEEIEAVRYNPLADAGGWGIRFSRKYGRVVNVSGDRGVRIVAGKRRMLIGSERPEELAEALMAGRKRRIHHRGTEGTEGRTDRVGAGSGEL